MNHRSLNLGRGGARAVLHLLLLWPALAASGATRYVWLKQRLEKVEKRLSTQDGDAR